MVGDTSERLRRFHESTLKARRVVEAVDKKRTRLNCIADLLAKVPCGEVPHSQMTLPERIRNPNYIRGPVPQDMYVPAIC